MKTLDIADEMVVLGLRWARVFAEPGTGERLHFEDFVPVIDEYLNQLVLDVGLLASIGNSPGSYRSC